MDFKSKFNFGERPWSITSTPKQIFETCLFCAGISKIIGADNTNTDCPKCYGKGGNKRWVNNGWHVGRQLTVGEIRIEHKCKQVGIDLIFSNYGPQEESYKETYMCVETGIGSGSLHDVDTLFHTQEEAQIECDRRNDEPTLQEGE